ncbi:MAG: glycosyl transferase family 2 [Bacteroidetes bacterium]|nr:glycosyl transferase family 2 [Bacteroidota bacterium]
MLIVFFLFVGAVVFQLAYYILIFSRLSYSKEPHYEPDGYPPVSIVICAKNEAENLAHNLKVIMIQHYPKFEVIIVNDQSTDNTVEVVADFFKRNDNIRLFNIKPGDKPMPGKKFALKTGVDAAQYDIVVVTDADCKPYSAHWLEHIIGAYVGGTDFVLGYSPYYKHPGVLNKIIRYENVMTAMQYMSFAQAGMPYMGVGRNMSFRKKVFTGWDPSHKSKKVQSGDDDLFVNAKAKGRTTEICTHKDSFTYSEAETTLGAWIRQKARHIGSATHYKFHHKVLLFLFALSDFLFYTTFIVLCIKSFILLFVLLSGFFVVYTKRIVTTRINTKLQQSDLSPWLFILDPLYVVYLFSIFMISLFRPKQEWK